MRTWIFILCCAVLGALLGANLAKRELGEFEGVDAILGSSQPHPLEEDGPRVAVDSETYDFGTMERNTTQSHEFIFTNRGTAPLTLRVGETTCKCTIADDPDKPLAVGESVPVKLEWTAVGPDPRFRQSATVLTNDLNQPRVNLTVVGNVTSATMVQPSMLTFGDISHSETRQREAIVVSFHAEDFEIGDTSIVGPVAAEHFDIKISPAQGEDIANIVDAVAGYRVALTARSSLPFGPITGWVRLETNLETAPQLDIPFSGRVVSDLSIVGPGYSGEKNIVNLGKVRSEEGRRTQLFFFLRESASKATLELVETTPDSLHAELKEPEEIKPGLVRIPLELGIPPGAPQGVFVGGPDGKVGKVKIATTYQPASEITLEVRFTVE